MIFFWDGFFPYICYITEYGNTELKRFFSLYISIYIGTRAQKNFFSGDSEPSRFIVQIFPSLSKVTQKNFFTGGPKNGQREKNQQFLEECTQDDKMIFWNQYCDAANRPDDTIFPMDDFDEMFYGVKPFELARSLFNGDFNPNENYWYFNGYGNPVSAWFVDDCEAFWPEEFAEYCIEHNEDFDSPEIRAILDESEDVAKSA